MNIEGLDYNTQRPKLLQREYGRDIQKMIDHAVQLPTKEERQRCAEAIVKVMQRMQPQGQKGSDFEQKLWDHLAIMSNFQLDIDYPYEMPLPDNIHTKPEPIPYPGNRIPIKHYGKMLFDIFEILKKEPPGPQKERLEKLAAYQMKRCLVAWAPGSTSNEKVAADLEKLTEGQSIIDPKLFAWEKTVTKEVERKRKRK